MLKPAHFQACVTISEASANWGSPIQARAHWPRPMLRRATLTTPQTQRAGAIVAGSLEQSNVEIAREFITLIEASTGISAASRGVRAADDLLQELLLLAR